ASPFPRSPTGVSGLRGACPPGLADGGFVGNPLLLSLTAVSPPAGTGSIFNPKSAFPNPLWGPPWGFAGRTRLSERSSKDRRRQGAGPGREEVAYSEPAGKKVSRRTT